MAVSTFVCPFLSFLEKLSNSIDAHLGGETYPWGSGWVQTHAQACVDAGKICIMEECKLLFSCIFAGKTDT
jgi:hypothetical protein